MLGCVGTVLVLSRQLNYGMHLNPDSVLYISIGDNLSEGEGYIDWETHQRFVPPLLSLLLAFVFSLGIENGIAAVAYVNAIIFGVTIIALLVWISGRIESRFLILWAGSVCALSPFLGDIFYSVRQESLFILLTVLSLLALDRFLDSNKQSNLILAAVFTGLSLLTRNMGIALVVSTVLILMARKGPAFRSRVRYIVIYFIISIAPMGIWILRNYLQFGRLTQKQWPHGFGWLTSIDVASLTFTKWIVGGDYGFDYLNRLTERSRISLNDLSVRIAFLVIVIAIFGYGLACLRRGGRLKELNGLTVPAVFISVYLFTLAAILPLIDFGLEPRLIAPIYVPTLAFIAIILAGIKGLYLSEKRSLKLPFIRDRTIRIKVIRGYIAMMCLFLWLPLPAFSSYVLIKKHLESGFGYLSKSWTESETIQLLKSNPLNGYIWSNETRAIYVHMNENIPANVEVHYFPMTGNLSSFWLKGCGAPDLDMYVVWFHGRQAPIPPKYNLMELPLSELKVIAVLEDGVILKACPTNTDRSLNEELLFEGILGDASLVVSPEIIRSRFDIYLDSDRLIYTANPCSGVDTEIPFFLHIYPTDRTDLPDHRKAFDFDNLDFNFYPEEFKDEVYGFTFGERCAITRNLPDYEYRMIVTGQWTAQEGSLWQETFSPTVR